MQTAPTILTFEPVGSTDRFYGFGFWYPTGISGQETGQAA